MGIFHFRALALDPDRGLDLNLLLPAGVVGWFRNLLSLTFPIYKMGI